MDLSSIYARGQNREEIFQVEKEHTAYHIGSGESRVLSTPSMISFMEQVAHRLLEENLPEDLLSVGIRVNIQHLAATPVGAKVRVQAVVKDIEGRRVGFEVTARDEQETIGAGYHQRAVVDADRFQAGIAAKRKT